MANRGPKEKATKGLAEMAKKARRPKAKTWASSAAYKVMRAAGATKERLRALGPIHRDGITNRDLLALALDLYYEAKAGLTGPTTVDADGTVLENVELMPRARALIQLEKAIELLRKLVDAEQVIARRDLHLHITVGGDGDRASVRGNGVQVVSAASVGEPT